MQFKKMAHCHNNYNNMKILHILESDVTVSDLSIHYR